MLILGIKGEGRNFVVSCKTQEEIALFEDVEEPISESLEHKEVFHAILIKSFVKTPI